MLAGAALLNTLLGGGMTKTTRADELDRERVVRALQEHLGIHLMRIGSRRKWLRDDDGRSYWVLVGTGDWHGIPQDMMDAEAERPSGGMLVIASRLRDRLRIFIGPLDALVASRRKLPRTAAGDYQFNVATQGARLFVKEVLQAVLRELPAEPYSAADKEKDETIRSIKRLLMRLSSEERAQLLREFARQNE
jgi:hypothetical protein